MHEKPEPQQPHRRRRKVVTGTHNGFALGTEEQGYDANLLDATHEVLDASLAAHAKVLAKRYDLHLPKDTPPEVANDIIGDVVREIARNFRRPRKRGVEKVRPGLDALYIMTLEQHDSPVPHGHLLLTLNGDLVQSGYYPTQEMKGIVRRKLGTDTLLHECDHGEWLIHRGDDAELREVIRATSYMSKVRTKEHNTGRELMRSQLKKKHGDD